MNQRERGYFQVKERHTDLSSLEEALGYRFRSRALLVHALTHSSYANEHKKEGAEHNERLEFLGDAILEMCSSDYLYHRYPEKNEGELSKLRASLVCEPTLALCARDFNLMPYLRLGKGEDMAGGRSRDSIVSDAVESVIAAIYLDGGYEPARQFILEHILNDIDSKKLYVDSKSLLQEKAQAAGQTVMYRVIDEKGPDHDKWFTVEVLVGGTICAAGDGHTKKSAEQNAAFRALRAEKD